MNTPALSAYNVKTSVKPVSFGKTNTNPRPNNRSYNTGIIAGERILHSGSINNGTKPHTTKLRTTAAKRLNPTQRLEKHITETANAIKKATRTKPTTNKGFFKTVAGLFSR